MNMNLKVTIDIDGTPHTKELSTTESLAHIFVIDALQEILLEAGIIDEGNMLEVIDSDQSKLLEGAGY
jgi:hypothetical protein